MKKIIFIVFAVVFVFALVLTACNSGTPKEPGVYEVPEEIKTLPEGTTLGLRAPEIVLPNLAGEKMRLSDLHGKLVLVDFWASWCNPCRQENPVLVKVYNKYKDASFAKGEGFEIFSVSIDRNEKAWREAIKKDGMNWEYQLSDLIGAGSPPAQAYGIRMIPSNFLLDQNGVVIATNLRGDALEEKLESLMPE